MIRNLQDGFPPKFGDEVEQSLRAKLLDEVEQLAKVLAPVARHGGIGHNNPPLEDDDPTIEITDFAKAVETIQSELGASEPNALEVAKATSRLKAALDWMGSKADIWVESFAKESGSAAGKWFTKIVAADVAWHTFNGLAKNVVETATHWLHHVTSLF